MKRRHFITRAWQAVVGVVVAPTALAGEKVFVATVRKSGGLEPEAGSEGLCDAHESFWDALDGRKVKIIYHKDGFDFRFTD